LLLSGIIDTGASVAGTNITDNEVTSNLSEANNSSASATITITMWVTPLPDEQVRQGDLVEQQECRTRRFEEVVGVQEGQRTPVENLTLGGKRWAYWVEYS